MKSQPYCIAVCDDEPLEQKMIKQKTQKVCETEGIPAEISCFESAGKLLRSMENGQNFDLLLLDVMMPVQDGIDLARFLRKEQVNKPIVFISSSLEFALQGYEVSAARYLEKPLKDECLREAVLYCYEKTRRKEEMLFPISGGVKKVNPKEICYIEISGRKSLVVQENEEWETSFHMKELEEMLSEHGFIRCHQSFLVNCRFVRTFQNTFMELTDKRKIPVSKHRLKEVRSQFLEFTDR